MTTNTFAFEHIQLSLKGKKILLGITGSIAAFKACDIIRYLRECGAEVRVILSEGGKNFVTPLTLETLSGNPVLEHFWKHTDQSTQTGTYHIETARWADAILIAPATAHFIGKMANGLADDLLSTELLAFQGPVFVTPAMNPVMYSHSAVQENIKKLEARGINLIGPVDGSTACGEHGLGRMLEPELIVEELSIRLSQLDLKNSPSRGKKVLVTLGPTLSYLDPVRFITNRSSGRMGAALCWAATYAGLEVTAICGPHLDPSAILPRSVIRVNTQTTNEMLQAVQERWSEQDIFIGSAAVLDWEVHKPSSRKLKKEEGIPHVEFTQAKDILAWVSENRTSKQWVLGFSAETHDPLVHSLEKLKRKGCQALFVNDVSQPEQGFESAWNGGWWLMPPDTVIEIPRLRKSELARRLIELIQEKGQG